MRSVHKRMSPLVIALLAFGLLIGGWSPQAWADAVLFCGPADENPDNEIRCEGTTISGIDVAEKLSEGHSVLSLVGVHATNESEDAEAVVYYFDGQTLNIDGETSIVFETNGHGSAIVAYGGDDRQINNAGTIVAQATSQEEDTLVAAAGILLISDLADLDSTKSVSNDGTIEVYADADLAVAGGLLAVGSNNFMENAGTLDVMAEGETLAVAMGAVGIGVANPVENAEGAEMYVDAHADDFAAAVGMAGLGILTYLENAEDAELSVHASANTAVAAGQVVAGLGTVADNSGTLDVMAEGETLAAAIGAAAIGIANSVENAEDAHLTVEATADQAAAAGQVVAGLANAAHNVGTVDVNANGEAPALALGIVGVGVLNEVHNLEGGLLTVTATGENAIAYGLAVAGDKSVALNEGTVTVDATGTAVDADDWTGAVGMGALGSGNLLGNSGNIEAYATSADSAGAIGIEAWGSRNLLVSTGNITVDAFGNLAEGVGAGAWGSGNLVANVGTVSVSVDGDDFDDREDNLIDAAGLQAVGHLNLLINSGTIDVEASGEDIRAAGMMAEGKGNVLTNRVSELFGDDEEHVAGTIFVQAEGDSATAAGMFAQGDFNILRNRDGANIHVSADGEGAQAAGMGVAGSHNLIRNSGIVTAEVTGGDQDGERAAVRGMSADGDSNWLLNVGENATVAVWVEDGSAEAMGMAVVGTTNRLLNSGLVYVSGESGNDFDPENVAGLVARGDENSVINIGVGDAGVVVEATGEARAMGMWTEGEANRLINLGNVAVTAEGDWSTAVGLIAEGDDNSIDNVNVLVVTAGRTDSGHERESAVGLAASGQGNQLGNIGDVTVTAGGPESIDARAIGILSWGTDDWIGHAREVQGDEETTEGAGLLHVEATGDSALAVGMMAVQWSSDEEHDEDDATETHLNNAGTMTVAVDGNEAQAFGMNAVGDKAQLINDTWIDIETSVLIGDATIGVTARGDSAQATGIRASGGDNEARNNGTIIVEAAGKSVRAVGMDLVGDENDGRNSPNGRIEVTVEGDPAGEEWSTGIGMRAEGTGNDLLNRSSVEVEAKGPFARGAGMVVLGEESRATNYEAINVTAGAQDRGDVLAEAVGLVAEGEGHWLWNGDPSSVLDLSAEISVEAWGEEALASGVDIVGSGNNAGNQGTITVAVQGTQPGEESGFSLAIGMAADGHDNKLSNGNWIAVNAEGEAVVALGVELTGRDNEATNLGTIKVTSETEDSEAHAVGLVAFGNRHTLTNTSGARLTVTADGGPAFAAGLSASGQDNTLRNSGSIEVSASGDKAEAVGITASGAASIENTDDIDVEATSSATGIAALALNGTIDVTNTGSIVASAGETASGAYLEAVGANGLVTLINGDEHGIAATLRAESSGENGSAVGVRIVQTQASAQHGSIEITNEANARIEGADGSIVVENGGQAYQSITVVNKGILAGDVIISAQETRVELHDGSATIGDVRLGDGESEAVIWAGADLSDIGFIDGEGGRNVLTLTAADDHSLGDISDADIRNFQRTNIEKGTWSLNQDTTSEGTTILNSDATLQVDDLQLGSNSVLGGTGTIVGNVNNQAGTIAPGHSPGTLTIQGNYTHGADGTFQVDIDLTHPELHGKLEVKEDPVNPGSGNALLQGGHVQANPEGSLRAFRHADPNDLSYTILETEGTITGTFNPQVRSTRPSAFLQFELEYPDDRQVILVLTPLDFQDVADSANERAIGTLLDLMANPAGDPDLVNAAYTARTQQEARQWLNQLSGDIYTAFPVVGTAQMDRFVQEVIQGLAHPAAEEGRQGWIAAYGTAGKVKDDENVAEAEFNVTGGVAGMHVLTGPNGRVGLTAGFAHNTVDMADRKSKLTGDGYQLGIYGQYEMGRVRVTGVFAHDSTRYDASRRLVFGDASDTFNRQATGRFDGKHLIGSLRGELLQRPGSGVAIEPIFGLSWRSISRHGFTEEGANEANLRVDSYSASYLQGDVGVRLAMKPRTTRGGWTLTPSLRATYVHDFSTPSRDMTIRFQDLPDDPQTVKGRKHETSGIQVGLGLEGFRDEGQLGWNLHYEGEFRSDVQTHSVHGGLNYRF